MCFPILSNKNQHQTDSNSVLHLQILKNIILISSSSGKNQLPLGVSTILYLSLFTLITANNLNFYWRWRWWNRIPAIFLNHFYFTTYLKEVILGWFWNFARQGRLIMELFSAGQLAQRQMQRGVLLIKSGEYSIYIKIVSSYCFLLYWSSLN